MLWLELELRQAKPSLAPALGGTQAFKPTFLVPTAFKPTVLMATSTPRTQSPNRAARAILEPRRLPPWPNCRVWLFDHTISIPR